MDNETKTLMRDSPGSIGETARAFATSFSRIVTERTDKLDIFNNGLHMALMYRALVFEKTGNTQGNLLLPIHIKGVDEIHRLYDIASQSKDIKYKLDLPTMILYAMLLESSPYREGFAGMSYGDIKIALGIIHQEIMKTCPYQVLIGEDDYSYFNTLLSQSFLIKADRSLSASIAQKLKL